MGTKATQYTIAYTKRAVRLCDESNRPIAEVARNLGVEYATLYGWMKKAGKTKRRVGPADPPIAAGAPGSPAAIQTEIDRLRRELDEAKEQLEFEKKSGGVLRAAKQVKFDFIAAENARHQFPVRFMCRELEVSTSGYYAYLKRGISQRKREDLELTPLVHAEFNKHTRGCGSRM